MKTCFAYIAPRPTDTLPKEGNLHALLGLDDFVPTPLSFGEGLGVRKMGVIFCRNASKVMIHASNMLNQTTE